MPVEDITATTPPCHPPPEIKLLIDEGALFVSNHSGGKDSQAMLIHLLSIVPRDQVLVVHASLGDIEWPGALELAEKQASAAGVPFIVARAARSFFDMVQSKYEKRPDVPCWPSAMNRQCTSDLKRGPIEREVRRYAKARGITKIVACMGIRAAESRARAKKQALTKNVSQSIAGRDWFIWLPIHQWSTEEVFASIGAAGQKPHWAYGGGNERLSCMFCIMGSRNDLRHAARRNPELFRKYVALEKRTGYTMHQSRKPLAELCGPQETPA